MLHPVRMLVAPEIIRDETFYRMAKKGYERIGAAELIESRIAERDVCSHASDVAIKHVKQHHFTQVRHLTYGSW